MTTISLTESIRNDLLQVWCTQEEKTKRVWVHANFAGYVGAALVPRNATPKSVRIITRRLAQNVIEHVLKVNQE